MIRTAIGHPTRIALLFMLWVGHPALAQRPSPGAIQVKSILIKGAMVHVGDGRTVDDGAVGFRNGKIDYVGFSYGVKAAYDTVVDASGKHVYPGLILVDGTLGVHEIDLVRATADEEETGVLEPEVRSLTAYNADSRLVNVTRGNGVLLEQVVPRGNVISGTSGVVRFDAWDSDDAVVRKDDGVHVNWPEALPRRSHEEERPDSAPKQDERTKQLEGIRRFFQLAKAYAASPVAERTDLRMEAMRGLFDGGLTLYVHADRVREIQESVLLAREMGIAHTVIVGGYDAWRVADLLREKKVDVILPRVHGLPQREDDPVDLPYRLPALLKERGVRFCLGMAGDMERAVSRNLCFQAGTASAYGLTREEALRSITLDAAAILGIDKDYGSLEPGKSATLFISTGDALDMRTNNVEQAFIDGRRLILDDHQKQLYRQYEERYK